MKVIVRLKATSYFFDEDGRSQFPLYWTSQPRDFKEWPMPMGGADELEILLLFDALSRKLPIWRFISAYAESAQWAVVKVMRLCFSYRSVLSLVF